MSDQDRQLSKVGKKAPGIQPLWPVDEGSPKPVVAAPKAAETPSPSDLIFFTICSKNFLSQGITLYDSLVRAHGPIQFYLVLCDTTAGVDVLSFPFPIIEIETLGISEWPAMCERYSITELNTSVKPFAIEYLFDLHPGRNVVYLDPDIIVVSALKEIAQMFSEGAECLLTPHIAEPAEFAEFNDQKFLQYGVYNLGFGAFKDTPQVRRAVSWWGRRLLTQCTIDLANGIFVDQKWADLLPAYIEKTRILRHPGYNVAYWNLSQRKVTRVDEKWFSNDAELRFVHFSGSVIGSKTVFSRHSGTFTRANVGVLSELLAEYESRLFDNGHKWFKKLPFGYKWNGATGVNLHTPENSGVAPSDAPQETMAWLTTSDPASLGSYSTMETLSEQTQLARRALEQKLVTSPLDGHCALCGRDTKFSFKATQNWREQLECEHCGLSNRARASLHLFLQNHAPRSADRILVTEAAGTPTVSWLKTRFNELTAGELTTPLEYADASFDFILSFEALGRVRNDERAFTELLRCLKPGGTLLFTVPFAVDSEQDVDPKGPHRAFGWSLLRRLERLGFESVAGHSYWSRALGYLGAHQLLFTATKPKS